MHCLTRHLHVVSLLFFSLTFLSISAQAVTLEEVYDNEALTCGVTTGETGFSAPDSKNDWHGMEVDLCRAVSLAIFGSRNKSYTELVPLVSSERLTAVGTGKVHILAAKTYWNWLESVDYNVQMIGPYFHDGQGFLIRNDKKIRSAWNLQNVSICVVSSSQEELQVRRFLKLLKHHTSLSLFDELDDIQIKFEEGSCDVITADITKLSEIRQRLRNPISVSILPQLISMKPIGMITSIEDPEWPQLVQLIFSALVQAEELGLTSRNIAKAKESGTAQQKEFINFGESDRFDLFNSSNWIFQVISALGNYGEIYRRHFGPNTISEYSRGLNRSWFSGGLLVQPSLYFSKVPLEDPDEVPKVDE